MTCCAEIQSPESPAAARVRERPCRRRAAGQRDEIARPQVDHATTSQWADHGILSLQ